MSATAPSITSTPSEQRFVLYDVDWEFYERLLEKLDNRRVFVTYDHGTLELLSPSRKHATSSMLVTRMLFIVTEELVMPIASCGSTTFRRQELDCGLEPDQCFYIENEARVRGQRESDLSKDPPPDLAVEVEITRRLLDREGIYASLGVPQLWRYDGEHLRVFVLDASGKYQRVDRSPTFPTLPLEQVDRFLGLSQTVDETTWVHQVRAWVKEHLVKP